MSKFKVGDKVTDGNSVFQITKVTPDDYVWKLIKGDGKDAFGKIISEGGMVSWADLTMRKAANAKFKVGDRVERSGGQYSGAPMIVKKVNADGTVTAYFEENGKSGIPYTLPESAFKVWRNSAITSTNPVVANAIKACNGNNWTMADAKEWASSLSVIADKDYNDDWLKEGLDSFKRYGKQFANLVGPSEAKKVEDAIRKGRAKDLPRLIGSMKPYKASGSLVNAVAKNAVDPLDTLNSAETYMRQAIGELGKVTDPDLRPLASRIATKLKAVQGELRRELAV